MMPERYIGPVMELCRERRGVNTTFNYLAVGRVELTSELPLAEVLFDFYDRLKSLTQGYGSFDYEMLDYRETDLVKIDILVNARAGRCPVATGPPGQGARARAALLRAAGRDHPAPPVQDRDPGRDRRDDHRPQQCPGPAQGRHGQVLRRRHHPQAQAAGEAERRQEAHEDRRAVDIPQSAFRRRAQDGHRPLSEGGPVCICTSPSAPDLPVLRFCRPDRRPGAAAALRRSPAGGRSSCTPATRCASTRSTSAGGTPIPARAGGPGADRRGPRGTICGSPTSRWIFLEANPEDVTPSRLAAWRRLGVDTLSLGVQSLEPGAD